MSNDSRTIKNEKKTTPVTIVPAKASLRKINRKVEPRYRHWLDIQKLRKQYLKKIEVVSKGKRERIHVSQTTRSRRSRSRMLEKNRVKKDNNNYRRNTND